MKRKELTNIFMMISNGKTLWSFGLYKKNIGSVALVFRIIGNERGSFGKAYGRIMKARFIKLVFNTNHLV